MKMSVAVGFLCTFVSCNLAAQVQGGTIIDWMASSHDLVLAADSRVVCIGAGCAGRSTYRDDDCKIAPLGAKVIFSEAGVGGETQFGGWNGTKIAIDLASGRNLDSAASIDLLASEWLHHVRPLVESSCRRLHLPTNFLSKRKYTTAIFAGMTAEGTIHIAQVGFQVTLDNGHRDACTDDERHTSIEGGENIFAVRSFGSGMDAVESYFDRAGDKALYGNSKPVPSWQYFATITYKYAEIAIAQSPKNGDVGGEIDQVHLNVSGIHWLHQKAACRTSPE